MSLVSLGNKCFRTGGTLLPLLLLLLVVLLVILSLFVLHCDEYVFMNFSVPTDTALWHAFQQLLKFILCTHKFFIPSVAEM
jgi:hypothetical protein